MAATSSNCLAVVLKELGWSYTSRLGEASPRPPWAVQHPGGRPAPSPVPPLRHRRARAARSAAPTTGPAWAAMALWIAAHCSSTCFRSRRECARTRTAWSQACCALVGNIAIPQTSGTTAGPPPGPPNPSNNQPPEGFRSTLVRVNEAAPGPIYASGHRSPTMPPRRPAQRPSPCWPGGQEAGPRQSRQTTVRSSARSPARWAITSPTTSRATS
jgi:hypothetical protein